MYEKTWYNIMILSTVNHYLKHGLINNWNYLGKNVSKK